LTNRELTSSKFYIIIHVQLFLEFQENFFSNQTRESIPQIKRTINFPQTYNIKIKEQENYCEEMRFCTILKLTFKMKLNYA